MSPNANYSISCFGEVLGLIGNSAYSHLADCSTAELGFAGTESNVAIALARLGVPVRYVTALGDDPFGRKILKGLRAEGVDVAGAEITSERPTAIMLRDRIPWAEPSVFYYRRLSAFASRCATLAEAIDLDKSGNLFLSGITPALNTECREAMGRLLKRGASEGTQVWFDVNFRAKLWSPTEAVKFIRDHLQYIHGIFTSREEARMLFPGNEGISERFLDAGTKEVVIKAGAEGASYTSAETALSCPAFPISQEIDPIGAGDAFDAGFLSARFDGLPIAAQLERGCALGAMACLSRGDWEGLPMRPDLERFLRRETASLR